MAQAVALAGDDIGGFELVGVEELLIAFHLHSGILAGAIDDGKHAMTVPATG